MRMMVIAVLLNLFHIGWSLFWLMTSSFGLRWRRHRSPERWRRPRQRGQEWDRNQFLLTQLTMFRYAHVRPISWTILGIVRGGRTQSHDSYVSNIKKCVYKPNERLYGQSNKGRNVCARISTNWTCLAVKTASRGSPSVKLVTCNLSLQGEP